MVPPDRRDGDDASTRFVEASLGPAHRIDAFVEPMTWGRATYTVIRMPQLLVDDARALGTTRVGGDLEGVPVNVALTRAPVLPEVFVWAGSSLLRRLRLEVGDPVSGFLAPVDPSHVLLPPDLVDALGAEGLRDAWNSLTPSTRPKRLVAVDATATATSRASRIRALLDALR